MSKEEREAKIRTKEKLLTNAKTLRTHQTKTEQRLWYHLRAHRFLNLKFKRQKPIGHYIVDFLCEEHRLIIELDGGQHSEQEAYDQQRDAWLRGQGYTVLRFWNNDVMQNLEGVLEQIRITIAPPSPPAPTHEPHAFVGRDLSRRCSRIDKKRRAKARPTKNSTVHGIQFGRTLIGCGLSRKRERGAKTKRRLSMNICPSPLARLRERVRERVRTYER